MNTFVAAVGAFVVAAAVVPTPGRFVPVVPAAVVPAAFVPAPAVPVAEGSAASVLCAGTVLSGAEMLPLLSGVTAEEGSGCGVLPQAVSAAAASRAAVNRAILRFVLIVMPPVIIAVTA